jgi:hypothetical protein
MVNISSLVQRVVGSCRNGGVFSTSNRNEINAINDLFTVGDSRLSHVSLTRSFGGALEARPSRQVACCSTLQARPNPVTLSTASLSNMVERVARYCGEKGLTVPQNLLNEIGAGDVVYVRPLSSSSFLVMRTRGTNSDTVMVRRGANGSVTINRTTLAAVMDNMVAQDLVGEEFSFRQHGSTRNCILVESLS